MKWRFSSGLQDLVKAQGTEEKREHQSRIIKNIIVGGQESIKNKLKMVDQVILDHAADIVQEQTE